MVDLELRGGHAQFCRGHLEERLACLRRGATELRAPTLHAAAADGAPLIDRELAVPLHPRDACGCHVELLGHDLPERRGDTRPQLDLTGVDRHALVPAD